MATIVTTNIGKAQAAKRLAGVTATAPQYIAIGTGVHTAAATDTALTTEIQRVGTNAPVTDTTTVTNDTFKVSQAFTFSGDVNVTEIGLLDAASAGNLIVSITDTAIPFHNGDSVTFTIKIAVA